MSDDYDTRLTLTTAEAEQREKQKLLDAYKAWEAARTPPSPAPSGTGSPAAPKKAPAQVGGEAKASPEILSESLKATAGGLLDAVTGSYNSYQDMVERLGSQFLESRRGFGTGVSDTMSVLANPVTAAMGAAQSAREAVVGKADRLENPVPENQTTPGKVGRSLTQFVLPTLGYLRALGGVKKGQVLANFAKGSVAGALTDASVQAPNERNLSNLILDMGGADNRIISPIAEFLAADPNDSQSFGRFKKVVEGLALGGMIETVVTGAAAALKAVRMGGKNEALDRMLTEAGKAPAEPPKVDTPSASPTVPPAASPAAVEPPKDAAPAAVVDEVTPPAQAVEEPSPNAAQQAAKDPDVVEYYDPDGAVAVGQVRKMLPNGKAIVEDPATGKVKVVEPIVDDLMEPPSTSFRDSQAGGASPAVLAQMGGAVAGGAAGASQIEEGDSLEMRIAKVAGGAAAGLGAASVATRVLTSRNLDEALTEDPVVASLARPEMQAISPRADLAAARKAAPVVDSAKVSQLADALASGEGRSLADAVQETDFNFAYIDNAADIDEAINAVSKQFESEIDVAKRGVQSFADMEALAREIGADGKLADDLFQGTDKLAERTLALRTMVASSGAQVTKLSRMILDGAGGMEAGADNILALRKQLTLHAALQARMKGVQTETARALAQYRITANTVELSRVERDELIRQLGGMENNLELARKLSDITDPEKLNAVARKGSEATTSDAVYEAYVNGLLSGPPTHIANAIGNSIVALGSVAEKYTAAGFGLVFRKGVDRVTFKEANAYVVGMGQAVKETLWLSSDGIRKMASATGDAFGGNFKEAHKKLLDNPLYSAFTSDSFGSRMSNPDAMARGGSIAADTFGLDSRGWAGMAVNGLGTLVRVPGKALAAADEFFWALNYRGELYAQAYRDVSSRGLSGDDAAKEIARLLEEPSEGMRLAALKAGKEGTFTKELGKGGRGLQQAVTYTPGARYIMPFVRTPINILKYAYERSPLGIISADVREELLAGGARQQAALARISLGSMVLMASADLALGGVASSDGTRYRLVGGGDKKQNAERLAGALPYSLEVTSPDGSKAYTSFNRLDPLGIQLGWAADMADLLSKSSEMTAEEMAIAGAIAVSRNLVDKSYLAGLADFLDATNDPDRFMARWVQNHVASRVPFTAALNTARREDDGHAKYAWTIMDAVKARIPGLSGDVPNQVNVFGEDIETPKALGPEWLSPIYQSSGSTHPAAIEIARLNLDLQKPAKSIAAGRGQPSVDLTPQQYRRLMQLLGNGDKGRPGFREMANKLVQSGWYRNLPDAPEGTDYRGPKQLLLSRTYEQAGAQARVLLLQEDKELAAKVRTAKDNVRRAKFGKQLIPTE
jgi:hypothetical protein